VHWTGSGRRRNLHDADEALPNLQKPATFTEWEDISADSDVMFYEGLHGGVVNGTVNVARHNPYAGAVT
jgi:phosphoribulokinase